MSVPKKMRAQKKFVTHFYYSPLFFALIMESNQQPKEEEEECSICLDSLQMYGSTKFARASCCGKGIHIKCRDGVLASVLASSLSAKQKRHCVMCRTKYPPSEKEAVEQLRPWVEKGKAWAQGMLGCRYRDGEGVDQSYQRAAELLGLAATQGNVKAQYNLGCMYKEGKGVDQSYERAVEYYKPAARGGMAIAQYNLGFMYAEGQGVDQSYERAAEYYEAAARQGHVNAQFNLGALYANGQGVEQSIETAREWLMKSAEQGGELAIKNLQKLDLIEGRTTPSFTPPKRCSTCDAPKTSTHKLRNCKCKSAQYCNAEYQKSHWKSHQKEHRRLCKEMELTNTEGEMKDEVVEEEEEGETKEAVSLPLPQQQEEENVCPVCIEAVQKNSSKFVRYTCCGKGIHIWCNEGIKVSSLSYEQKTSCPLCRTKAPTSEENIEQIRRWVEKGKAWAQSSLGDMYRDGDGVDQSYQRAKEMFELAASQGCADAQFSLGLMYDNGEGVDQNDEKAAEYYEAAARQGHGLAQLNLGILYVQGNGVEQSIETGRAWLMKAAEQGDEQAIKVLQKLDKHEGRTTPSFIPKPIECASCYRPHDPSEHKLRPCNGCHRVYYCGRECQVKGSAIKKKQNKKIIEIILHTLYLNFLVPEAFAQIQKNLHVHTLTSPPVVMYTHTYVLYHDTTPWYVVPISVA